MLKIAHRGDSGNVVENSLASFRKAIELGADGIELDVWNCKSGELIVFHDKFLDRMTTTAGLVYDKTLNELKQLKLWFKGEETNQTIPTLQEVFTLVKESAKQDFKVLIELKGCDLEEKVVELIQCNNFHNSSIVISFRHDRVLKIKELDQRIKTGVLLNAVPVNLIKVIEKAQADMLIISQEFIVLKDIKSVQERGHDVLIFTVNTQKAIEKMKNKNVDGIISDHPELLIESVQAVN